MTTPPDKAIDITPVTISIVGTGNSKGGGVAPTPDGTIAQTPAGQPNLLIKTIGPVRAIAVRFGHLYFKSFAAAVVLAMGGGTDILGAIALCWLPALSVPGVGLLWDIVTVFGRLEGRYPLATGSI